MTASLANNVDANVDTVVAMKDAALATSPTNFVEDNEATFLFSIFLIDESIKAMYETEFCFAANGNLSSHCITRLTDFEPQTNHIHW
jgi:hypothetical protein